MFFLIFSLRLGGWGRSQDRVLFSACSREPEGWCSLAPRPALGEGMEPLAGLLAAVAVGPLCSEENAVARCTMVWLFTVSVPD